MKVALTSLLFCDMPFTESSIIAQRTKMSFTKQRDDKVHLKIGEELQNYLRPRVQSRTEINSCQPTRREENE